MKEVKIVNNYCRNCGIKLDNNAIVCPNCKAEVFEKRINVEEKNNEVRDLKKKEKKYLLIIIGLIALNIIISCIYEYFKIDFLSYLFPLLNLAPIIMFIYSRIVLKDSKIFKIIFNIIIVLIGLHILYSLLIVIACVGIINGGCR